MAVKKAPKKKMVKVAKGKRISRAAEKKLEQKPGGSNTGEYKNVKKSDFAGSSGGTSPYSYPINTLKRAKSALKLAHNAPDPSGIKRKVYAKYPELKPKGKARGKKK